MKILKIQRCMPVLLAAVFCTLAGCDGTPVAPEASPIDAMRQITAQTESTPPAASRSQCTNNLHSGFVLHAVAPSQEVEGQDGRKWGFRANVLIWDDDGNACGEARIEPPPSAAKFTIDRSPPELEILDFTFGWGRIASQDERGIVLEFGGEVEICSQRGGGRSDCRTGFFEATAAQQEQTGSGMQPSVWTFSGDVPAQYNDGGPVEWAYNIPEHQAK
jgi:hypothetical protein